MMLLCSTFEERSLLHKPACSESFILPSGGYDISKLPIAPDANWDAVARAMKAMEDGFVSQRSVCEIAGYDYDKENKEMRESQS
jgi:hypothetical protein